MKDIFFRRRGFTIIELLVVIAIIGVLASIVLAAVGDARDSARETRALAELKSVNNAMALLNKDTNLYPHKETRVCPPFTDTGNEINLSTDAAGLVTTDGTYTNWNGPYISTTTDPWGNPYFLDEDYYCTSGALGCNGHDSPTGVDADRSVLVSCGPDGLIGTAPGMPNNGIGCAYNDDNVVLVLCGS